MKKLNWKLTALISIATLFIILSFVSLANSKTEEKETKNELVGTVTATMEYAYMEGQRDYAEGDIRIKKVGDDWEWTSSPWDGGSKPVYNLLSEY